MKRQLVYCFDIDGVIAENTIGSVIPVSEIETWEPRNWIDYFYQCQPNKQVIALMESLYEQGYIIKLYTARHSWSTEVTVEWLLKFNVKYHDIKFDKPQAHVYIDDRGYHFETIEKLQDEIKSGLAIQRGFVDKQE